jgi:hypothetical protein
LQVAQVFSGFLAGFDRSSGPVYPFQLDEWRRGSATSVHGTKVFALFAKAQRPDPAEVVDSAQVVELIEWCKLRIGPPGPGMGAVNHTAAPGVWLSVG